MSPTATRIVFVCTGNICRSPLAEAVLRHELESRGVADKFHVDSAGTDAYHVGEQSDPRMRKVARENGIRIDHRSRRFGRGEAGEWDLIVALDRGHERTLLRQARTPQEREKIILLRSLDSQAGDPDYPDVPDPWYGGMSGFDTVYEMVGRTCRILADRLVAGEPAIDN